MAKSLYDILGVKKDASSDDIRRAYRKLARKYHPDVNPGDQKAEDRFKRVSAAYEVLSDADKRKTYDEFGEDSLKGGFDPTQARAYKKWQQSRTRSTMQFDESDLDFDLADMFGFGRQGGGGKARGGKARGGRQARRPAGGGAARGTDIHAIVDMSLQQVITGGEVKLDIPGRGKPLTVRIPPGADNDSVIRLPGKGEPSQHGGKPGDLVIKTRVQEHPLIKRDGFDLYMTLPVTLDEAYNGSTITIPSFHGLVNVRVPAQSQSGDRVRVRGKGVRRKDRVGDLFVILEVRLPDQPSKELSSALRKSRNSYSKPVREEIRL